jgi:hypothetical protein
MKLSPRRFTLEDFKEQQGWIGQLLSPLNQTIQELFTGFNNNLTIADNLRQEIKDIRLVNETSNFPIKFKTKFTQNPKGLQVIYCAGSDGVALTATPWITWVYNNGQIEISSITSLVASTTYTIRILVIYE